MRAAPSERETSDLEQEVDELQAYLVERVTRLVNTGCVIAFAGTNAEEAKVLILEINTTVQGLEEASGELAQRGH